MPTAPTKRLHQMNKQHFSNPSPKMRTSFFRYSPTANTIFRPILTSYVRNPLIMDDTDLKFTQTAQKEASPLCNVKNGLNGSEFCRIQNSRPIKCFEQQDESCCSPTIFNSGCVGTRISSMGTPSRAPSA